MSMNHLSVVSKAAGPILSTKLHIPRDNRLLPRKKIADKLLQADRAKCILVSAPAGYGKTSVIVEWVQETNVLDSWLSLEEKDNDPIRFMHYVLAALSTIDPDLTTNAEVFLDARRMESFDLVLTALINDLVEYDRDVYLILDDYHQIQRPDIHNVIRMLIEQSPNNFHVVLITRSDPPFPLHRLRLKTQLLELRTEDLRFNREEIEEYMAWIPELKTSTEDISLISERTEGWIAGIQAVAISLKNRYNILELNKLSGNQHVIFDYLTTEVLSKYPRHIQLFLYKCSILSKMNADLCGSITGKPADTFLQELLRQNAFIVPLDENREWFRFHQLFRDALQKCLLQVMAPDEMKMLHRTASEWFYAHGYIAEAIDHALLGEEYSLATSFVDELAPELLKKRELATLLNWISLFSPLFIKNEPRLCIIRAWIYALDENLDEAEMALHCAEAALRNRKSPLSEACKSRLLVEIDVLRGYMEIFRKNISRALDFLHSSVSHEHKYSRFFQKGINLNSGEPIILRSRLGVNGYLTKTMQLFPKLRETWKNSGLAIVGFGAVVMGEALYEMNELEQVNYFVSRGIELGTRNENLGMLVPIYFTYVHLKRALGERRLMWVVVDELKQVLEKYHAPLYWISIVQALQVRLWIEEENRDSVERWFSETTLSHINPVSSIQEYEFTTYVRALIFLGKYEETYSILAKLYQIAEKEDRLGSKIEICILQSFVYDKEGQVEKANHVLLQALKMGHSEKYVRTFFDEGIVMYRLLSQLKSGETIVKQHLIEYIEDLLTLLRKEYDLNESESADSFIEEVDGKLTKREREILALIQEGLSNIEISQKLHISVGTVKGYVNKVYTKLKVKNRTQAIKKARELALLK